MKPLSDDIPISKLTIPGTHDSGAMSYVPFVGCQMTTIQTQLENGIRYFDLRAGYGFFGKATEPMIHHDFYRIFAKEPGTSNWNIPNYFSSIPLREVFATFYKFLDKHPKEGLIVQIKHDGFGVDPLRGPLDDAQTDWELKLSNDVWDMIQKPSDLPYWVLTPKIPKLGDLRKKIQLLRRFLNGFGTSEQNLNPGEPSTNMPAYRGEYGIPLLMSWTDAPKEERIGITFRNNQVEQQIILQDYYNLQWEQSDNYNSLPTKKFDLVHVLLEKASQPAADPNTWYLNFASGVRKGPMGLISQAHTVATGFWNTSWIPIIDPYSVNALLLGYFTYKGPGSYGTILMDFPEQPSELIIAIVRTNFKI